MSFVRRSAKIIRDRIGFKISIKIIKDIKLIIKDNWEERFSNSKYSNNSQIVIFYHQYIYLANHNYLANKYHSQCLIYLQHNKDKLEIY